MAGIDLHVRPDNDGAGGNIVSGQANVLTRRRQPINSDGSRQGLAFFLHDDRIKSGRNGSARKNAHGRWSFMCPGPKGLPSRLTSDDWKSRGMTI